MGTLGTLGTLMLAGYAGHLLSAAFLEERTAVPNAVPSLDEARRLLAESRHERDALGPASSLRAMLHLGAAPLLASLGFEPPASGELIESPAVMTATVRNGSATCVLIVTPWGARMDPLWRCAVTQAAGRATRWVLVFNGTHLRIVDATRLFARRFAEFDLDLAMDDPQTLAALWTVASSRSLSGEHAEASLDRLVDASDRHAVGVCRSLRAGVLSASADLLGALVGAGRLPEPSSLSDAFEQALTVVYRLLFLLFAEARTLVPIWHPVYRESYSVEALRVAAEIPRDEGLWDALRAITRLAHAGCHAGDLRVTPFNGRLFAPGRTPLADRRDLSDQAARRAVLALATRQTAGGRGRELIAYRDLGVEQLGAVYETLLDYEPRARRLPPSPRSRGRVEVALVPGSGVRKATGTFYTPQPIAEYVVRRSLAPLVADQAPEQILKLRILDPAMGSGAFLVAACRYLAAAYETALVRSGSCHEADIGEPDRALWRRSIAERCLYGVDLNPMAVQLARLSLWLATLAADRPITFLDHRFLVGDSLLGAWLAQLGHSPEPPRRRRQDTSTRSLFDESVLRSAVIDALPVRFTLESAPADTVGQVRAKERALAGLSAPDRALARWKRIADLWCATWFATTDQLVPAAAFADLSDTILTGRGTLPPRTAAAYLEATDALARDRRFFHWELEFPEVFFDSDGNRLRDGGFDAVIGNPPWDMIRADQGASDVRSRARADARRLLRFTRDAGVYHAQSGGQSNRYQLFLERAIALTRRGGRLGLVLPSGLAVDRGSAGLRRHLLASCDVDALVGFDNRRGVFPIHRSVGFLLVTASTGAPTRSIACRLGLDDPAALEAINVDSLTTASGAPMQVSPALLQRLSGDDLTIPLLRTPTDLAIAERAAALFPPLGSECGWSVQFGRELNATDDRPSLRAPQRGSLPVVEGKHLAPFHADLSAARFSIHRPDAERLLGDHSFERERLAYRDVASATNVLTLIAAVLPAGCVSTHTLFCLRTPIPAADQHLLCGLFNSYIVNFLVRPRVTTHVTTTTIERLPIPTRERAPGACREIAALARLLARRSDEAAFARLQALVAALYQLSAMEFEHVLSTFPLVAAEKRQAVLSAFLK